MHFYCAKWETENILRSCPFQKLRSQGCSGLLLNLITFAVFRITTTQPGCELHQDASCQQSHEPGSCMAIGAVFS